MPCEGRLHRPETVREAAAIIAGDVMVFQKQLTIPTRGHGDMHDLTEAVRRIVAESNIQTGVVHVFQIGSTGGVEQSNLSPA